MNRIAEIVLVIIYNLALLAGASYLVYYKDASAWLFILALIFAAGWKNGKEPVTVDIGK